MRSPHRYPRFLLVCGLGLVLAGQSPAQTVSVDNVQAALKGGGVVEITYDLAGAADEEYEVEVFLLVRQPSGQIRRKLSQVSGDVGVIKGGGKGRRILWAMNADLPSPIAGAEYEFEVTAELSGGGLSWYLYAGAAVVVGGIALFAIKPPAKEEEPVPIVKTIPLPPGR